MRRKRESRDMSEKEDLIARASALFKAFARGVASKDVREGRMSENAADTWMEHSVTEFESNLREQA
jgi:hypothetical protein